ncbi:eukaryotic aspartyl protease domain-containing protein [Ditylenchus destructor]|nr:eukaryotic aspartyl protease domain-containing protein [Ditylenchus destructor]
MYKCFVIVLLFVVLVNVTRSAIRGRRVSGKTVRHIVLTNTPLLNQFIPKGHSLPKQMSLLIILLFLATLLAQAESGGVLKIPAQAHRMPPEVVAQREHRFKKNILTAHEPKVNPKFQQAASTSLQVNATEYYDTMYFANITIGTPAQVLTVEIDPWYDQDLCVLGEGVDFSRSASKRTFNQSKSSSFVNIGKNFSMTSCGSGKNGTDVVNVGEVNKPVNFGIVQTMYSYLRWMPSDGILGINPKASANMSQNAISQLLEDMDSPIMTWWQNETIWCPNGTLPNAQLTLGAEDTEHCKSSYVYVPRVSSISSSDRYYPVHLTSAVISNDRDDYEEETEIRFDINATLTLWHGQRDTYGPRTFLKALVNATNGVYNYTVHDYVVDCDMSKHKDIVLNIGGSGVTEDKSSRQIILSPTDYVLYFDSYDVCVLSYHVVEYKYPRLELGLKFFNNHCLAYNSKEDKIGFSEVKEKKVKIR